MPAAPVILLERLHRRLKGIDLAGLGQDELREAARRARAIEDAARALLTVIGSQAIGPQTAPEPLATDAMTTDAMTADAMTADAMSTDPLTGLAGDRGRALVATLYDPSLSRRRNDEDLRRSAVTDTFEGFGPALLDGAVTVDHLDVLHHAVQPLRPAHQALLAAEHDKLLALAQQHTPRFFARLVDGIVEGIHGEAALEHALQQRAASELRSWTTADGMGHFRGCLDPERFSILIDALEREMAALANQSRNDGRTVAKDANLRAAALFELTTRRATAAGRAGISIVVDAETSVLGPHPRSLRETADGVPLSHPTFQRHRCDAEVRLVHLDGDGLPLSVGRNRRTATDAQWAALKALYSTCAWRNCDRPVSWCQAHHIVPWEQGGPTDLDNLVPLCSRHHHDVHEGRWTISLLTDRTLQICRPDGVPWADARPNRLHTSRDGPGRPSG